MKTISEQIREGALRKVKAMYSTKKMNTTNLNTSPKDMYCCFCIFDMTPLGKDRFYQIAYRTYKNNSISVPSSTVAKFCHTECYRKYIGLEPLLSPFLMEEYCNCSLCNNAFLDCTATGGVTIREIREINETGGELIGFKDVCVDCWMNAAGPNFFTGME